MNPFPSTAFKNALRGRTVECVPLLDVVLADGSTGYISDRRIVVGSTTYLPRLVKWGPISGNISGSSSTATFVLSNVDRVMELAARDHMFQRGIVTFKVYIPAVVSGGGSVSDATRIVWVGYIEKTPYDHETFSLSCKDGFFDLTLPLPRRRFSRNCDLEFDDGLYCPYSGFGYTGAGSGSPVSVPDIAGIFSETYVKDDFGPNISGTEGYHGAPGYTSCEKTFSACKLRKMARFYGGLRYTTSWATGRIGAGGFVGFFTGGDPYTSYSSINQTIYDQGIPLVYAGAATGFILNPILYQWRPESDFTAAEGIIGEGPIGNNPAVDPNTSAVNAGGIMDVLVNSLAPHGGQYPAVYGFGVARSAGRIGEPILWDGISGDMKQTDAPSDPPVYNSARAGFFARVKDTSSGVNSPNASSSTGVSSTPTVYANLFTGRRVWQYSTPTSRTYGAGGIYGGNGNPVWIILDMILEAFNIKYASIERHASVVDLQSFIDFAVYASENITGLDGNTVQRYQFAGQFANLAPALDQVDAALRDCHGFRFFRNGKIAVRPYSACQDATVRPAFQEFVNIKHNSFKPEIPIPAYNELNLNFADHDYDFQKNMATVYSIEYQKLIGMNGHPFKMAQSYNLTGTCLTEQAARLGLRMLRHELGGTSETQWAQVRNGELQSTILMSELEVGDITYLAHTLMPNGGDWVRVEEWSISDDWSMTFKVRSWRSSEYDDVLSSDPFVELARFPRNTYIRGSKGIVYPPLPALSWDPNNPCVSVPNVGVRLTWTPYTDQDKQKLLQAVQIFRTAGTNLGVGGYLLAEVDGTATAWLVDSTYADFETATDSNRNIYQCGDEQVACTNYHDNGDGTATITVTRAVNGTNAESHQKYDQVYHVSLLDQLPHPGQVQGLVKATQYIDPWEETTTTTTSTTTSTTTT